MEYICKNMSSRQKKRPATSVNPKNKHQKALLQIVKTSLLPLRLILVKKMRAMTVLVAMTNQRPIPDHTTSKKDIKEN